MPSIPPGQSNALLLQMLVPNLEAEGFQVLLNPSQSVLPSFMGDYRPDAIALRADKKLAIEVKSRTAKAKTFLNKLPAMFSGHPDWELRVIYAPTQDAYRQIEIMPRQRVAQNLDRLLEIFDNAGSVPALLTGWSVLEAAARAVCQGSLEQPQTTARLLEMLASDGYITPSEADVLRKLATLRNEAAHGQLNVTVTREQMGDLITISRGLLNVSTGGA